MTKNTRTTFGVMVVPTSVGKSRMIKDLFGTSELPTSGINFIDLEGNGYWDERQDIVELAIVTAVNSLRDLSLYTERFHPKTAITRTASRIHGIHNRDVEGKQNIEQAERDIRARIEGKIWAGHNTRSDQSILTKRIGEIAVAGSIDTLSLTRRFVPGLNSYTLESLITQLDLGPAVQKIAQTLLSKESTLKAHSAAFDCISSLALYEYLIERN